MPALYKFILVLPLLLGLGAAAQADDDDAPTVTPPRLSYIDGEISYWRPGAEDWLAARLNTPVAVGDEIYAGENAAFELQIGPRAFVRGDEQSQLALTNQEPDFIQFRATTGRVSLDLRQIDPGTTIEVATPNAVFTITGEGYYRLDIDGDTHFTTRRGGRATLAPAGARAMTILPSEEIVVRDGDPARIESYVAPEPDRWDQWNFARGDDLIDAASARYLPPGVYGADELDRHGDWRVVPEYGPVWIPEGVARSWAPYSTGSWIWDPYYEWTWIDDAPWGWAPYHYGRWVSLDGLWAWAPGPPASRRPHYSPALVAFFSDADEVSLRLGIGAPGLYWVSLSWGEPVVPWWGRPGFRGKPWWGGWHGPRLVNDIAIREKTVIDGTRIVYRNTRHERAVTYAPRERFGRRHEPNRQIERIDFRDKTRVHGALPVRPGPENVAIGIRKGVRPPQNKANRPVVLTRTPRETRLPWRSERPETEAAPKPAIRIVPAPKRDEPDRRRPEFGNQGAEERPRPPQPPRYREMWRAPEPARNAEPPAAIERGGKPPPTFQPGRETQPPKETRPEPREPGREDGAREKARQETRERSQEGRKALPGNPANRMFRRGDRDEDDKGGRRP